MLIIVKSKNPHYTSISSGVLRQATLLFTSLTQYRAQAVINEAKDGNGFSQRKIFLRTFHESRPKESACTLWLKKSVLAERAKRENIFPDTKRREIG